MVERDGWAVGLHGFEHGSPAPTFCHPSPLAEQEVDRERTVGSADVWRRGVAGGEEGALRGWEGANTSPSSPSHDGQSGRSGGLGKRDAIVRQGLRVLVMVRMVMVHVVVRNGHGDLHHVVLLLVMV